MYHQIFLDLDGTVHLSGNVLDDVDIEIQRLDALGAEFFYLTNNTSISSETYVEKLNNLGIRCDIDHIITPTKVCADFLRNRSDFIDFFPVGTSSFTDELLLKSSCNYSKDDPDVVIVGFDKELTYAKLEKACEHINRGVPYYITHIDLACPTSKGPIPDCGAIGKLFEATTGVAPMGNFGKPSDLLRQYILRILKGRAMVAGDRLYTDAQLGLDLSIDTILVKTGEFKGDQADVGDKIKLVETLAEFLRELG